MTTDELVELYFEMRSRVWSLNVGQLMDEAEAELIRELLALQRELKKELEKEAEQWGQASEWTAGMEKDVSLWLTSTLAAPSASVTEFVTAVSVGMATATATEYNSMLSFEGKAKNIKLMEGLTREQIKQFFEEQPLGGKLLKEWVQDAFDAGAQGSILKAVREGVVAGEGYEKIIDRVMQSTDIGFIRTRREIGVLVKTYIQSANIGAQEATYKQNEDIFKGYRRRETLDNRTCRMCLLADGTVYKVDEPRPSLPIHAGPCRGVYLPILKTWRDLGIDRDELEEVARPWTIRDKKNKIVDHGFIKGNGEDWFNSLSVENQAKTSIGPVRSKLLREGRLKWNDLLDKRTGIPKTLEELGYNLKGNWLAYDDKQPVTRVLRNIDRAEIPLPKLVHYALDPSSEVGGNKQRVLSSAFGFTADDVEEVRKQIFKRLPDSSVIKTTEDEHGEKVAVLLPLTGKNGHTEEVVTGWIYDKNKPYIPRLTTIFLPGTKRKRYVK